MRHVKLLVATLCLAFSLSAGAQSQETPDYFVGNWSILVKGTPQGDIKLVLALEKKDTALAAVVLDTTGKEFAKVDKIVRKDNMMTAYFSAMGYDLYLEMTRKDDDHMTGNLVGMFEAEAERIKAAAEKK
ncbi:MAG: hypothetical protein EBZ67_15500 [Chitinophagia bacterium]|nr:hypothetical protein [Chitinophagia bacterium]